MMHKFLCGVLIAASVATGASAQGYPTRPITMIVPFAAGGPTDTVARVTAETMGRILGQTIVVENTAGAGGTIGSNRVVRAQPDGYTLLLNHLGLATAVTLYRRLAFDPTTDLRPVGVVSDANMAIIARPGYSAATLADLVKDVSSRGDQVTFGHAGVGSSSQLCGLLLTSVTQKQMTQVPFRGGGPVLQALLANQLDIGCEQATTAGPLIQAGSVKSYAVTSPRRLDTLPNVPTSAEAGFPTIEVSVWHGLYAPAQTPDAIVDALARALAQALRDPALVRRFNDISTLPTPGKANPAALAQLLKSEIDRWRPLITAAGQFVD